MTWATLSTDHDLQLRPGTPKLAALQKMVDGWIEAISITIAGQNVSMYLNEEGKLIDLPPNIAATGLARGAISDWDVILGNVVLVGGPDRHGNDTSLTEPAVDWLVRRYLRRRTDESAAEFLVRLAARPVEYDR